MSNPPKMQRNDREDGTIMFSVSANFYAGYAMTGMMLKSSYEPEKQILERVEAGLRQKLLDEVRTLLEDEHEIPTREEIEAGRAALARERRARL